MPDNYLYLGLLAALFPRARFIHCRRDLRDTAVSCWMTIFRQIRWANDPAHIAARFAEYRRVMDHWRAALPVHAGEIMTPDEARRFVVGKLFVQDPQVFTGKARKMLEAAGSAARSVVDICDNHFHRPIFGDYWR